MNIIKTKLFYIISMSVARSLYRSILRNLKPSLPVRTDSKELISHTYVYNDELYTITGPHEDRIDNFVSVVKLKTLYGEKEKIDDLFKAHQVIKDFLNLNKNEKVGEYRWETRIEILDDN